MNNLFSLKKTTTFIKNFGKLYKHHHKEDPLQLVALSSHRSKDPHPQVIRGFCNGDFWPTMDAEPFLPKILLCFVSKVADADPTNDQNPRQIFCVQNPRLRPKTAENGRNFCQNTSISVHRRTQRRNLMMPILFIFM